MIYKVTLSLQPSDAEPFDWAIYADATLAGLADLIPIPFLDSLFEAFFRRRMPIAIARRHGQRLSPAALQALHATRSGWLDWVQSVLRWAVRFVFELILRLVRKLLYFLTVKRAADALTYYWQRAFLLDHMVRNGYLNDPAQVDRAVLTLDAVLAQSNNSSLRRLAGQIVFGPWRILRSLWQARQGKEDATLVETKSLMAQTWTTFAGDFSALAEQYDATYSTLGVPLA